MLDALEMAVTVARRDVAAPGGAVPPRPLQPVLRFARLPEKALEVVHRTLELDEAFRRHVAAEVDLDALSRGGRLFIERPDGWQDELELLVELERDRQQGSRIEELRRRVAALEGEVSNQRRRAEGAERSLHTAQERVLAAEAELAAARNGSETLRRELEVARDERARAVRQLKDAEVLAERRLAALREAELAAAPEPGPPATSEVEALRGARVELLAAADQARDLAARLQAAARATGPDRVEPPPEAPRRHRRVPLRIGQGLVADSADGLAQLLGTPDMVVLVDGYNVSMSGWPDQPISLQRDRLVDLLGGVVATRPAEVHVVFDGSGAGERPAVSQPLPVRVYFTEAGVEADDRLLEFARRFPESRPVTVVSSDRRVRAGAREAGANVVSASALLELGRR